MIKEILTKVKFDVVTTLEGMNLAAITYHRNARLSQRLLTDALKTAEEGLEEISGLKEAVPPANLGGWSLGRMMNEIVHRAPETELATRARQINLEIHNPRRRTEVALKRTTEIEKRDPLCRNLREKRGELAANTQQLGVPEREIWQRVQSGVDKGYGVASTLMGLNKTPTLVFPEDWKQEAVKARKVRKLVSMIEKLL